MAEESGMLPPRGTPFVQEGAREELSLSARPGIAGGLFSTVPAVMLTFRSTTKSTTSAKRVDRPGNACGCDFAIL
jgi:hypothetical protein